MDQPIPEGKPVLLKTCPHCAEEVQEAAVKCKHCKSDILPGSQASKNEGKDSESKSAQKKRNALAVFWLVYGAIFLNLLAALPVLGFLMALYPIWFVNTRKDKVKETGLARLKKIGGHKGRVALTVLVLLYAVLIQVGHSREAKQEALFAAAPQPSIEILSATDGKQPQGVPYVLQFRARDADYATVDGVQVQPDGEGVYEASVELADAYTYVMILAKNEFKQESKKITVERELSEEELALAEKTRREEEAEKREWESSKAGKLCAEHPSWDKVECTLVADNKYWVGMSLDMLKAQRGIPNAANPSNYGSGTRWQWCWYDYTPSCFYDNDEDGLVDSYN